MSFIQGFQVRERLYESKYSIVFEPFGITTNSPS